ncbi:SCO2400 family protein [Streptomyces erythrochromogenes]|uniref:SCO2400 family protein n=1 Tax=Streptomyces erythrochromogenes TaxID=285574 RepID=UPI0036B6C48F
MNYCHACRRHLNGALACAGCGTPAEYLIPAAPAAAGPPAPPVVEGPAADPPTALADVYADSLVVLSAPNERRAGARRRVTHRRRRRTVLTLSLGVLLATAGSLMVVSMAADGERTDRASDVVLVDDAPRDPAQLTQAPTAGAPSGSGKATAKAGGSTAKKSGSGAPTGSAGQPGPTESAPAPTTSGQASGTPGPGKSLQGGTGQPSQSVSGSATAPPPPAPPNPAPTPTKNCGFLGMLCWGD